MAMLLGFIIWVLGMALSWILTCGVIKLITLCFGWVFTWSIATGIWLIGVLVSSIVRAVVHVSVK